MFAGVGKLATRLKFISCARAPPAARARTEVRVVSRVILVPPERCLGDILWRRPMTRV
jgi:hypothetical protein